MFESKYYKLLSNQKELYNRGKKISYSSSSEITMRVFLFVLCPVTVDASRSPSLSGGSSVAPVSASEDGGSAAASDPFRGEDAFEGFLARGFGRGRGLGRGSATTTGVSSPSSSPMTPMSLSSESAFCSSTSTSGSPFHFL